MLNDHVVLLGLLKKAEEKALALYTNRAMVAHIVRDIRGVAGAVEERIKDYRAAAKAKATAAPIAAAAEKDDQAAAAAPPGKKGK